MAGCLALPFSVDPQSSESLAKLATIVTKCCLHHAWFEDRDWVLGEGHRRTMVIGRLSNADNKSWEVYKEGELVGLLHADDIIPQNSASVHMLFFDRILADRRTLCLNVMQHLYESYDLHTLRTRIPTYAAKLLGFVRKALGFRFESEMRNFSWPASATPLPADVAKLGSRLHQAVLHEGVWHDLLLLSQTRNEFVAWRKDHQHEVQPQVVV